MSPSTDKPSPARGLLRVLTAVMSLLFVYATAVQYNDPDPGHWIILYGSASLIAGLAARYRPSAYVCCVVAAVALAWACIISVDVPLLVAEVGREMVGLGIVAGWMLALAVATRRGYLK